MATTKFVIRVDDGLLHAFDELRKILGFKSRNEFVIHIMGKAVESYIRSLPTIDPEQLRDLLLVECKKMTDTKIFTLFYEQKESEVNPK